MIIAVRRTRTRAVTWIAVLCTLAIFIKTYVQHGYLPSLSPSAGEGLSWQGHNLGPSSFKKDHGPDPAKTLPSGTTAAIQYPHIQVVSGGVPPTEDMVEFWPHLLRALQATKPHTDQEVVILENVNDFDMDQSPSSDQTRGLVDKANLNDDLRNAMKAAHADFRQRAHNLSQQLPYAGKVPQHHSQQKLETLRDEATAGTEPTRGIVMTAGGRYIGVAVTSLLMLRHNGCTLPVQLFLDDISGFVDSLCQQFMPKLGVECHSMGAHWDVTPDMRTLSRFQLKIFAIIFSSYREVLFLDADVWPMWDPEPLFESEPFKSHGLVTWPDFWRLTSSPAVYDIMGIPEANPTHIFSTESGILLYDKKRHSLSLMMTAYYNYYGPSYYYPLLSQGAHGEGDKETFVHGAMVAGSPFYSVHTRLKALGHSRPDRFVMVGMKQADPKDDYYLYRETLAQKSTKKEDRQVDSGSHNNKEQAGGKKTVDGKDGDTVVDVKNEAGPSPEEKEQGKDVSETFEARYMFIHHNAFKLDMRDIGGSTNGVYDVDNEGKMGRLWGNQSELNSGAGYDVERTMWEVIRKAACQNTRPVATRECEDLENYFMGVFGGI